jgi:hypothetical protein
MDPMSKTKTRGFARKIGVAAITVGAAAAMAIAGATAANAATGSQNQGIADMHAVPDSPAVNFDTAGTTGLLVWSSWDGTAAGTANIAVGDTQVLVLNVPTGLVFADDACDTTTSTPTINVDCAITAGGHTLTITRTATQAFTRSTDYSTLTSGGDLPIVSTATAISGDPSGTFKQWDGLTTAAGSKTGVVDGEPAAGIPLVLGGGIAAGVLGLGAVVVLRRRKVNA